MDKDQDIIKNYVEQQLSETERRVFEETLKNNPDLAVEVQLFRDLKTVTQHKNAFDLKQKLKDIVKNTPIEPDFDADFDADTEGSSTPFLSSKIGRRAWIIVLLVGILAIITAVFWFQNKETTHIQQIAQQIDFQPFENIIQFDSTDTRPLARALQAYNKQAYNEAEMLLATHLKTQTTDTDALFYLGMCRGLTGRFDSASTVFASIEHVPNNPLAGPTHWYLALCYLHLGEVNKARVLLENLKTDTFFGKKAQNVLEKLEN